MINSEGIICILWITLSGFVAFQSIRLNLGSFVEPGPGFLPFCSSLIIGSLASILLLSKVFKRKKGHDIQTNKFRLGKLWIKAAYLMVGSFIYSFIIWEKVGYLIGTPIFLFFLLKVVGSQSFKKSALTSVGVTIVSYLIFQTWLQCMLPHGLLKGLLAK